ncbi:hypothetical protein [Ralstonia sp. UBA689]|uniref:hypothetical protein n=1 Tax=Ralstonia sp. UBA689 TaxID=1947373 RepID=UPI0025E14D89|nr:hypothetical protein [Ralstonia sp. UBA689]
MNIRSIFLSIGLVVATLPLAVVTTRASENETVTFTVEARALRYPFASPADNQVALAEMLKHASIVGHYWKLTTVLEMSRCMTGVTCYPSPHLEDIPKDHPVTVQPKVVFSVPGQEPVRLMFKLPVSHHSATLEGVSLILPLKFIWQQPSVQLALKKAAIALPDYEKTDNALKNEASVSINLALPQMLGEPGPMQDHCAGIPNPLSWSSSGVVAIRTLAQIGSKRDVPWSPTGRNETESRLGTEETCATWRSDVENSYLWRAEP